MGMGDVHPLESWRQVRESAVNNSLQVIAPMAVIEPRHLGGREGNAAQSTSPIKQMADAKDALAQTILLEGGMPAERGGLPRRPDAH
jgi:hypothetical protein